jgi:small subunit ribosomal protein S6
MSDNVKKYEAMFLLDSGNPDFAAASAPVQSILERYASKVLAIKPWDERRLAYEIQGRKRGLYVLSYFECDPLKVREVEHDCNLDERILRTVILHRETLTEEEINAQTPATGAPQRAPEPGEREEHDEGPRRERFGDRDERRAEKPQPAPETPEA